MNVADIMTPKPRTVPPGASLDEAMGLMDDGDLRHLPVVDDGRLVGVLSDRDLLEATGWLTPDESELREYAAHGGDDDSVADVMHPEVLTVTPQDSIVTLSLDIVLRGIGCMPVVEDGQLVGIVTEIDLLRAFVHAAGSGVLSGDFDPPVSDYMSEEIISIAHGTTLQEAIELARTRHIRHLPVIDEGRLVGILSDRDLRRALGRGQLEDQHIDGMMTEQVMTVRPEALISHAATMMSQGRISALPVIRDGKVVGIVTTTDIVEHCTNTLWEPDGFRSPEIGSGSA